MGNGWPKWPLTGTLALAASLALAGSAQAATFTVDGLGDEGDVTTGNGVCNTTGGGGPCTLRAAMDEANTLAGADEIVITATGTIQIFSGLPTITEPLTIAGPGPDQLTVRRVAVGPFRPFTIQSATTISGITIANGRDESIGQGGGIYITGGPTSTTLRDVDVTGNVAYGFGAVGGGISVAGPKLVIVDSTVRNNAAVSRTDVSSPHGGTSAGGGIFTNGSGSNLWIRGSTISGNSTHGTNASGTNGSGGSSFGGGIFVWGNLIVEGSTVSGNGALDPGGSNPGGFPGIARGGGIMVQAERADMLGSTIALNTSTNLASNIYAGTGGNPEVFLKSTIVAYGNGSASCLEGPSVAADRGFHSQGHNLSTDGSCELGNGGDIPFGEPLLEPLADNGGPTLTHAIPRTSIAVDSGIRSGILDGFGAGNNLPPTLTSSFTDQRGRGRPFDVAGTGNAAGGDGADIGAFERQADDVSAPPPGGGGSGAPPSPPPADLDPGPVEEPGGPSPSEGDLIDPQTAIEKGPRRKSEKTKATFEFGSSEVGARFECRLLKGGGKRAKQPQFKPCTSPKTYRGLDPGAYTFEVRALDAAGNLDGTPAKVKFKIVEG